MAKFIIIFCIFSNSYIAIKPHMLIYIPGHTQETFGSLYQNLVLTIMANGIIWFLGAQSFFMELWPLAMEHRFEKSLYGLGVVWESMLSCWNCFQTTTNLFQDDFSDIRTWMYFIVWLWYVWSVWHSFWCTHRLWWKM